MSQKAEFSISSVRRDGFSVFGKYEWSPGGDPGDDRQEGMMQDVRWEAGSNLEKEAMPSIERTIQLLQS